MRIVMISTNNFPSAVFQAPDGKAAQSFHPIISSSTRRNLSCSLSGFTGEAHASPGCSAPAPARASFLIRTTAALVLIQRASVRTAFSHSVISSLVSVAEELLGGLSPPQCQGAS